MGYTSSYAQDQINKVTGDGGKGKKKKSKVSGTKKKYNYDSDKGAKDSLGRLKMKKTITKK